ncbi:MAG TPA: TetR/AcrR family transcriptional regulator [Ginsengibacter sp.]|nr:TetR/AcrR family transcriptional regulator [Ginsengibacter sp.]HRP43828.1 TetR/AcrR family transcriptional regulator [Ginsengibacter sp.]
MEIRDRIKKCAEELFRVYGIRSVTMDEIALKLGVSKKTIYQSFNDKGELVDEVTRDILENNIKLAIASHEQARDAVEELFLAIRAIHTFLTDLNPSVLFDMQRGYPKTFKRFHDFRFGFLYKMIVDNMRWGKKEGLYREEINEDIYARLRIEMVSMAFNEQLFPRSGYALLEIQKQSLSMYMHSLVTPKGKKLIEKYAAKE